MQLHLNALEIVVNKLMLMQLVPTGQIPQVLDHAYVLLDFYGDHKIQNVYENAQNNLYADKFYAIRSSVTPDEGGKLIRMGFISTVYPKSVSELADMTNPVALGWIKNEWAGKYPINLIWSDFYNRADLVKLDKYLNGIKVDFINTKIGTGTNWSKWKKSNENKQ